MKYRIVNIVATANIGEPLNLEEIAGALDHLGYVIYDPRVFPGLILKTGNGVGVLLFRTGIMVIAGAKNTRDVEKTVKRVVKALRSYLNNTPRTIRVKIQNIVATARLGRPINLEELAQRLPDVLYIPEQFPGLIYRPGLGEPVLLVFATGSIVIVGAKTEEEVDIAYNRFRQIVEDLLDGRY